MKYKEVADEIIELDSIQIFQLTESVHRLKEINKSYQEEVFLLERLVESKNSQIENRNTVIEVMREDFLFKIKQEKDKKTKWGVVGLLLGILVGGAIALNI